MPDTQHVDAGKDFNPFSFLLEGQSEVIFILIVILFLVAILLIIPIRGKGRRGFF